MNTLMYSKKFSHSQLQMMHEFNGSTHDLGIELTRRGLDDMDNARLHYQNTTIDGDDITVTLSSESLEMR